jgi:hypothetical protein
VTGGMGVVMAALSFYNSSEKFCGTRECPFYSDDFKHEAAV